MKERGGGDNGEGKRKKQKRTTKKGVKMEGEGMRRKRKQTNKQTKNEQSEF